MPKTRKVRIGSAGGEIEFAVRIINAARSKNYRMWFSAPDTLTLSKPARSGESEALDFLFQNSDWILKNRGNEIPTTTLSDYLKEYPALHFDGEAWLAQIIPARSESFVYQDDREHKIIFAALGDSGAELEKIFFKFARARISKLANLASLETGLGFSKISVRDQSSRWASRSSSGTLSFNWRIALLPEHLQNYIVRHELAHTKFMDHSTAFWIFLNRICQPAKKLDAELAKVSGNFFRIRLS